MLRVMPTADKAELEAEERAEEQSGRRARGRELASSRRFGRARLLGSACELLDPALGGVELRLAEGVELLAAFPQLERLVERRLPALEPLHDLLELGLRLLERLLAPARSRCDLLDACAEAAFGERDVHMRARGDAGGRGHDVAGVRPDDRVPSLECLHR